MDLRPYTYYLYHTPTGNKYYGVRISPKDIPEKDLWNTYFSSSELVKILIEQYGKESFVPEVRKVFNNSEDALQWEQNVLQKLKVVERKDWLNQSYSFGPFRSNSSMKGKHHSEETKRKIRESNLGKKRSKETKIRIGLASKGRVLSEETKSKMSVSGKLRPPKTAEHKQKLRESNLGKKRSEETKLRVSLANIGKIMPQEIRDKISKANTGKKRSEKSKQKMRESWKLRKMSNGRI